MTVINKWNNNLYEIVKDSGTNIELRRNSDGEIFSISKSEFNFSYKPYLKKQIK